MPALLLSLPTEGRHGLGDAQTRGTYIYGDWRAISDVSKGLERPGVPTLSSANGPLMANRRPVVSLSTPPPTRCQSCTGVHRKS